MTRSTAGQRPPARSDHARNASKLQLEVVGGIHRGVALALDPGRYCIGSSPLADIVLSDRGVAPEHATLRLDGATTRIDATGGDLSVDRNLIPAAHGCRARLPLELALGDARLRLSNPREQARSWLIRRPLTSASAFLAVIALSVVAHGIPHPAGTAGLSVNAGPGQTPDRADITGAIRDSATANGLLAATQAARELSARLAAAKIAGLQVRALDGRLAVSGTMSQQQASDWTAIQQWFDQTYAGRVVLTADVTADASHTMPAMQLQAIWYGDHPYIITGSGERYYQGAVLDNGWIIRQIGEDRLLLAKNGETVALTYR